MGPCDECGDNPGRFRVSDLTDGNTIDLCPACMPGFAVGVATALLDEVPVAPAPEEANADRIAAIVEEWEPDDGTDPGRDPGPASDAGEEEDATEVEQQPAADVQG